MEQQKEQRRYIHDHRDSERDDERNTSQIIEEIPFGIWVCDSEGGLTYASDSFLELIDMTMEEASGFGWATKLTKDQGDSLERWRDCVARGRDWDDEHRIIDSNGRTRTLLARGHAVRNGSGVIQHWVGVHIDITARKKSEDRQQLRKLLEGRQQERERISKRLHDHLQQLLIGARLRLTLLEQAASTRDSDEIDHILSIIGDAIDASRHLATELNPSVVHDSDLKTALSWLRDYMRETYDFEVVLDLRLSEQPDDKELRIMWFDITRELLLNIVKHGQVDRGMVWASTEEGTFHLEVADEGAGFDPSSLMNQNQTVEGSGLLGIWTRIEKLGGQVSVTSAPGQGTKVKLELPVDN